MEPDYAKKLTWLFGSDKIDGISDGSSLSSTSSESFSSSPRSVS
jgi:hypothetical protein